MTFFVNVSKQTSEMIIFLKASPFVWLHRLFLLRVSQSNPKAFVLTLCHHQKIKHFQILPVWISWCLNIFLLFILFENTLCVEEVYKVAVVQIKLIPVKSQVLIHGRYCSANHRKALFVLSLLVTEDKPNTYTRCSWKKKVAQIQEIDLRIIYYVLCFF